MATLEERSQLISSLFLHGVMLVLVLLASSGRSASGQDCLYRYLKQPPSQLHCNPYESETASLKIECVASIPATDAPRTEIIWLYNSREIMNGSFAPLERITEEQNVTDNDVAIVTSRITFREGGLNETYRGNYSCQVVVDDNLSLTSSTRPLVLEVQLAYIQEDTCKTVQTEEPSGIICARNIVNPATTEPVTATSSSAEPTFSTSSFSSSSSFPSSGSTNQPTTVTTVAGTNQTGRGTSLQVWVYVLVVIAAVFGMIIVVLTILCVGLCLKKNKTTDSFKQKGVEVQQFTTNSMISNGVYQRKDENGITSGTHFTSHSQISDYSTLGERVYEVVDVGNDKQDYQRLHHPSTSMQPNGRNAPMFNSLSPTQDLQSMSTLTSQLGNGSGRVLMPRGATNKMYLMKSASEGPEDHLYRELEQTPNFDATTGKRNDIYRSPTDSTPPDSAQPDGGAKFSDQGSFVINSSEALYSPKFNTSQRFVQGGLSNMPETGAIFPEPTNPTAFPVHKYEKIPDIGYETPIITKKKMTLPSPDAPAVSQQGSNGVRLRADSGARYETELQQNLMEEPQYNKLARQDLKKGGPLKPSASVPGLMGEGERTELQDFPGERFDTLPSLPYHTGVTGDASRHTSISSANEPSFTYKVSSRNNHEIAVPIEVFHADGETLFGEVNETRFHNHPNTNRKPFDATTRNGSFLQRDFQKRAWSEERDSAVSHMQNNMYISRSTFSGENVNNSWSKNRVRQMNTQENGLDSRIIGECKTMV